MSRGPQYTPDEDATVREYASLKTAEEIGTMLGRTTGSVYSRCHLLGVDGRLRGENHKGSKLSRLQVQMLTALYQAGFTSIEIQRAVFDHVTVTTVVNVVTGITHLSDTVGGVKC